MGQVVLMKMAMGRHPAVDVNVSWSVLRDTCLHYYTMDDSNVYVVGAGLQSAAVDPTNAIYLADLEESDQFLSLLLVRGDPKRAVPAYVNPVSRVVKQTKPDEPGFVPGASCHIVISKQEIASGSDQGRYRMVMELTRGIGRQLAKDYLLKLLARYADEFPSKFVAEKKRRKKNDPLEEIQYRPTVRFQPQMNGNLKKDLEEGRIGGFKLMRGSTSFQGEADEPSLQRLDVQLQARIAPTNDFSKVRKLVDHVRQTLGGISFEALNVELVDDSGRPVDNIKTTLQDEDIDEGSMRYCKTVTIPGSDDASTECHSALHSPTKIFAIKCIQTAEHWK